MHDDEIVVALRRSPTGFAAAVGPSLESFIKPFFKRLVAGDEADASIGKLLVLQQHFDANLLTGPHGCDRVRDGYNFQSMTERLVKARIIRINLVETGTDHEKGLC